MFKRLRNKIEVLASHNTEKKISLENLLYMFIYVYEGAEEINAGSNCEVHNPSEFGIPLYGFLGIAKEFLLNEQVVDTINGLDDETQGRVVQVTDDIKKIEPTLASVHAKLIEAQELEARLKEKNTFLQKQNDELNRLKEEIIALEKENERLEKPELGELDTLRKNIADLRDRCDVLNEQAAQHTEERDKLKSDHDERTAELQCAERKNDGLVQDIKQTESTIKKLRGEQEGLENKLKCLEEDLKSISPAENRKKHNKLLVEAKQLIAWWESIKADVIYEEMVKKIDSGEVEEKLHRLSQELKGELDELQKNIDARQKKYGEFLAQWENKIQGNKENVK